MLVAVSVIGAITGIPPPLREQIKMGVSTWVHVAEAYMATGPTPRIPSRDPTQISPAHVSTVVPAAFEDSVMEAWPIPTTHQSACMVMFCIEQWSSNELYIAAGVLLAVPTACVVLTLCFVVWLVRTQPSKHARTAWYCLSATLHQYDRLPPQARTAMVTRIGMSHDQAETFFQQLRKLFAAVQQTPME